MPPVRVVQIGVKRRTNRTYQWSAHFAQFDVIPLNFNNAILGHRLDAFNFWRETICRNSVFGTNQIKVNGKVAHQLVDDVAAQLIVCGQRYSFFYGAFAAFDRALPAGECRVILGIALRQG